MLPVKWHLLASYVCVIWRQNLHKLICVFHFNLVIDTSGFPVVLAAKGCCCRFDFCFPIPYWIYIFRVTNVTTSGERTPKTTVFILSNGGIDTVSLHSLNFCLLLTNKVRHLHWIIDKDKAYCILLPRKIQYLVWVDCCI